MIAPNDQSNIEASGRSLELIYRQLEYLKNGGLPLQNLEVATIGNGIIQLSTSDIENALRSYEEEDGSKKWSKFVPASGAASRMFAYLYTFIDAASNPNFDLEQYKVENKDIAVFIDGIRHFPFFKEVEAYLDSNKEATAFQNENFYTSFIKAMISTDHLGFGQYPKGLLPFFPQENGNTLTAFEAQLLESIALFPANTPIEVHFTISKEHRPLFDKKEAAFRKNIAPELNRLLTVNYSYQNYLTDTPVLDENNDWIRDQSGALFFRKGGHGALLENLNQLDADKLWIKNIDNIQMGEENKVGLYWQKILGGYLTTIQNQLFAHLKTLEEEDTSDFQVVIEFIKTYFNPQYSVDEGSQKPIKQKLIDYLDRPLRICAMIPNEGAAGGGPLWEQSSRGRTLQIIEGVEINTELPENKTLLQAATHFNPVLIACGITNRKGEKYPLHDFRNQKRYMVVNKTLEGKKIKSLEWPGLWNGGMAFWNTIFIEVPGDTFHPVKKLNDLLQ